MNTFILLFLFHSSAHYDVYSPATVEVSHWCHMLGHNIQYPPHWSSHFAELCRWVLTVTLALWVSMQLIKGDAGWKAGEQETLNVCCGSLAATHNTLSVPAWVSCKQRQLAKQYTHTVSDRAEITGERESVSSWFILEQCTEGQTELEFGLRK